VAQGTPEREVLDALWDLVWAGEVTNDTFAPLRALRWRRPSGERRPRPGRLLSAPPEAAGRWSLVAAGAIAPTARLHSVVLAMLERHGVLTREAVASEEVAGGFSGVYPVLRAMEEAGKIRRGYFVEGLGAAQFALPGAVDRLRSMREPSEGGPQVRLLAAADPANPYGAAAPWPRAGRDDRRPLQRAAGAYVVLVGGAAVFYLERGGHSLQSLPAAADEDTARLALASFRDLVESGRVRELVITRVDGAPVAGSPWRDALEAAGFVPGYRGHALRPRAQGRGGAGF
jgi:ATP-dependent Lhr-like helicase